jgi:MFS family permease
VARSTSSLWTNRDYLGWWTGSTVSALGTSVSAIAYPLLVLYTTGSVARAGVIGAANLLGTLLTTLWGGALADRVSRKAIMIFGPLAQGAAVASTAALVRAGFTPVGLLALAAFAGGAAAGITAGAITPSLRRIVPRAQVSAATSQEMGRDMAARLVGGPLGGLLFTIGAWFPFALDAVSYAFAAMGAMLIRRPLGPDRTTERRSPVHTDLAEGFRFVRRQPFLRFVVLWGALLNILGQGFFLLLIALVRVRGGGPAAVGLVNSVALLGGLAGAVAGPLILNRFRARLVLYAVLWTFVATVAAAAFVPQLWEIGAVLLLAMFALVPLNVVFETYAIRLVPDRLSGRVAAVNRFGGQSLQWLGPLGAGVLADRFGVTWAIGTVAVVMVGLTLAVHLSTSLGVLDHPAAELDELRPDDPKGPTHGRRKPPHRKPTDRRGDAARTVRRRPGDPRLPELDRPVDAQPTGQPRQPAGTAQR